MWSLNKVIHIVGFNRGGDIVLRQKFKRLALIKEFENCRHILSAWKLV